jgi:hypothetical protein
MTQRLVTGLLMLLTLALFAGFVLSTAALFAPAGCSEGDIGCAAASSSVSGIGFAGMILFGTLTWVGWASLRRWRDR